MQADKREIQEAREKEQQSLQNKRVRNMLMMFAMFAFALIAIVNTAQPAKADMATDMQNFTWIISNYTTMFTNMMGVFMQPPLVYFVVLGLFVSFVGLVAGLLMRRRRRR